MKISASIRLAFDGAPSSNLDYGLRKGRLNKILNMVYKIKPYLFVMDIIPNFDTKLFSFTFFPGTENICYYMLKNR